MFHEFHYTNALGIRKILVVNDDLKNEKYVCTLYGNGDWCGSGEFTKEELNDYLKHYHINYQF